MTTNCPLCNSASEVFYQTKKQTYHKCNNCNGVFADKSNLLSNADEKLRYENHNNDIEDPKYQQFVSPITSSVFRDYSAENKGLDFGAGPGPVISKVLNDKNYNIKQYDPIFHNHKELLNNTYNYIVCCEVIEHFYNPKKEFTLLDSLITKKGKLYCMTEVYNNDIDFEKWYYKNDNTHVFFYHKKSLKWIVDNTNFVDVKIDGRLIVFSK
ncbi:MAG: class I SAM-dependent methyltransferase [Ichthyobacteriaceae bacterium]|nr:class I SAM-dependent methyltransferase [Ichthyobacteriaceae bacterium]